MRRESSAFEVLRVFLRLGLTSFGGPIAHLGYFEAELVERRKWIDAAGYADLVALCQFLPGPASSQVGMALGIERAGLWGGLAAWVGFTLPSALALVLFAMGLQALAAPGLVHGLEVVAVPVVALAIWSMARSLCTDRPRASIAVGAAVVALAWQGAWVQVAVLLAAALVGVAVYREDPSLVVATPRERSAVSPRAGRIALAVFALLLVGLPFASRAHLIPGVEVIDRFYRAGALVFGGGHVVLPLLEQEVVSPGWLTHDQFLAGYGAAQAVPGPLFSIAAYLGFLLDTTPTGWLGAATALVSVFAPSYLLVVGALPFWSRLRSSPRAQAALRGTNAAVVGLLVAAFYDPVWTSSIATPLDFGIALVAGLALSVWKVPPWMVVAAAAALGFFVR